MAPIFRGAGCRHPVDGALALTGNGPDRLDIMGRTKLKMRSIAEQVECFGDAVLDFFGRPDVRSLY